MKKLIFPIAVLAMTTVYWSGVETTAAPVPVVLQEEDAAKKQSEIAEEIANMFGPQESGDENPAEAKKTAESMNPADAQGSKSPSNNKAKNGVVGSGNSDKNNAESKGDSATAVLNNSQKISGDEVKDSPEKGSSESEKNEDLAGKIVPDDATPIVDESGTTSGYQPNASTGASDTTLIPSVVEGDCDCGDSLDKNVQSIQSEMAVGGAIHATMPYHQTAPARKNWGCFSKGNSRPSPFRDSGKSSYWSPYGVDISNSGPGNGYWNGDGAFGN